MSESEQLTTVIQMPWLTIIFSILTIGVSIFGSIFSVKYFNKQPIIWDIKQKALIKSLKFLDHYLSDILKGGDIIRQGKSERKYTKEARRCVRELMLTAREQKLPKRFIEICNSLSTNDSTDINGEINEYRNLCRKELGLNKNKNKSKNNNDDFFIKIMKLPNPTQGNEGKHMNLDNYKCDKIEIELDGQEQTLADLFPDGCANLATLNEQEVKKITIIFKDKDKK